MSEPKRKYRIPAMEAVYPPRFEAGDKAAEAFFQENGYAVYKDVATADELKRGEDLFWAWMEEYTDVVRDDISTWSNRKWPGYTGLGIINSNGVGQSEFLWFVRGLRPIHTLFSDLWHDDDLISSFDGCGAFRPIQKNPEWTTKTGWYHTDQNGHSKPGLKSIQGLLNFYDSGPEDGGLVLVPGSNRYFEEMYRRFPTIAHPDGNDQVRIDETAFDEWTALAEEWSLRPIKTCLHPGDFVVWDSRTIHCNTPPVPVVHNEFPRHDLRRLVAYVSMSPLSSVVDFGVLEKRKNALFAGIACNHWAHEFHPIRGAGPAGFRPPVLDANQKALVCGRDYDWGQEGVSSSSPTHFFQKGQYTKKKKSSKK